MAVLIVASSEPRVGKSLIAAALAYRAGRDGRTVTLARLAGDESAAADAATFARLDGVVASQAPVEADAAAAIGGDVILEAPAGAVAALAQKLNARVLSVGRATSQDVDVPAAARAGTIVTDVAPAEVTHVRGRAGVLAVLAEDRVLAGPSVDDIVAALSAKWLVDPGPRDTVDRVMLGTIASDAAGPYFAAHERKCVVTRYDKTDVQLAALSTDLKLLVLTGGGAPSPYLLDRVASERDGISVVLADATTVEAMRLIEDLYRRSRFDGGGKLARAVELLDAQNVTVGF